MVRISDIFGQSFQNGASGEEKNAPIKMSLSGALHKGTEVASAESKQLYEEAVLVASQIYRSVWEFSADCLTKINPVVEKFVDLLAQGNNGLLQLVLSDYAKSADYLYSHVVNVTVISLEIGIGLGYEKRRLMELGVTCFFHDVGIIEYLNIINKAGVLSKEEFNKIKDHPDKSSAILNKLSVAVTTAISQTVSQEHERMDGSGYPKGIKDGEISEGAQIIGLADVYEAMLHTRPYRGRYTPLETLKTVLNDKVAFNARLIKILIERIGIFPVGTLVCLTTKEIGVVVKGNLQLPLRPVVNILRDAYGKELKQEKQIDLAENSMISIEECLQKE